MKKTILAVDDNESITAMIKEQLKTLNPDWTILTASGGEEGLRILEKHKVDLVLLDIMMPVMDGWTVAYKIKGNPKLKKVPIVFLTAKTDTISKEMGDFMGDNYIEKPYDMHDLNKRIKQLLK